MAKANLHNIRQKLEALDGDLGVVGNDLFEKKATPEKDEAIRECRTLVRKAIDVLKKVKSDANLYD